MREITKLGIKGTCSTKSYSLFECPVCLKQLEIRTSRGIKQNTCKDCRGTQNVTHGCSNTKQYYVWQSMRQRCNNPKNVKYHIYGGKGIIVDPDWDTFAGFWKDMGDAYVEGLTIDREDSSKNYCKENCRWVTLSQNSRETTKRRPVLQFRVAKKPITQYVFIQEFESAGQAAEVLGLTAAHITVVCRGKRKTHGGFAWRYKEENI